MARQAGKSRGKKRRKPDRRGRAVASAEQTAKPKGWLSRYGLAGVAVVVLIGAAIITTQGDRIGHKPPGDGDEDNPLVHHAYSTDGPRTLVELLELPDDELAQLDIAVMNLLCAEGLPGAEDIDIEAATAKLDEWALQADTFTERHMYRLNDPRYYERWGGSEARFRTEMLLQVLQEDCGVAYNEHSKFDVDFSRSKHLFIHGLMPDEDGQVNGGTCVSMPVVYAAVGRRLGYPIHLTTTAAHVFCRWEGEDHDNPRWRDRFNIEGSGEGFSTYDDDYYMTWPKEVSAGQLAAFRFLETLTPRQELAMFLAARGHNLVANELFRNADIVFGRAREYHPETRLYEFFQNDVQRHIARLVRQDQQRQMNEATAHFAEIERTNREMQAWMEQQQGPHGGFPNQPQNPGFGPPPGVQPAQPGVPGQPAFDPYR